MAIQDADQYGAFVQTTQVWDTAQLEQVNVNTPEFKELLVRLYQQINLIATVLNIKDTGKYVLSEFVNGQLFFPNPSSAVGNPFGQQERQVVRKVINVGALTNATPVAVAHDITCTTVTTFTRIYGCASDTTNKSYIPIPNTGAFDVSIEVDATNVNIVPTVDLSSYNICYVIVEYLQT